MVDPLKLEQFLPPASSTPVPRNRVQQRSMRSMSRQICKTIVCCLHHPPLSPKIRSAPLPVIISGPPLYPFCFKINMWEQHTDGSPLIFCITELPPQLPHSSEAFQFAASLTNPISEMPSLSSSFYDAGDDEIGHDGVHYDGKQPIIT